MATTGPSENGAAVKSPVLSPLTTTATTEPTTATVEYEPSEVAAAADAAPPQQEAEELAATVEKTKWPGWPGDCVFRLIVPVLKVGSIIGRKGELIKRMCEETRARIRVLDGPVSSPDRIVLISGKEELEATLSPAMDAVIRVFRRVNELPDVEGDGKASGAVGSAFCSIRLLVASTQAINLIGKQGSLIKSIQETTGASVRVLSNEDMPVYASSEERIVEIQGEASKVLKALEAVVGHLRKFLVDHSVLPLFEKSYNTPSIQEHQVEPWSEKALQHSTRPSVTGNDYSLPMKRETLFLDHESPLESRLSSSRLALYGQDPVLSGLGSSGFGSSRLGSSGLDYSGLGRPGGPIVTQVAQTMQIPLTFAEDIIGVGGKNIAYIRRTSGAILTVQESRGLADEITVEIKGTSSQVQTAQQLIQDFIGGHKEPLTSSSYGKLDSGLRSSYSQLGSSSYPSSYTGQYGSYGSSGLGGYSSFRL